MQTKTEKLPKSTIKLTVSVESAKVKEAYEKVLDDSVKNTEIEGFRKGNAPREMVKEKIGDQNLFGEAINELLQIFYPQALKENAILPISNPRVEIKEFALDKDFEFTAEIALKPEVKIGDYKKALKNVYEAKLANSRKESEEKLKKGEELEHTHVHMGTNELIDTLLKESEVDIANLLVEDESNRLMTRLVSQAESISLSLDQYLKAQNKTAEQLHKEYDEIAEKNLKAEFVLSQLVKDEKIEVTDEEIDEAINAVGDPATQERLKDPMERLYVKSILQKNKLISKLIEETEGENHHDH